MAIRMKPEDRKALWEDMELLQCNRCGDIKGVEGFGANKGSSGQWGYMPDCRKCGTHSSNKSHKLRLKEDPIYRYSLRIRVTIGTSLRSKGWKKRSETHKLLGATYETVWEHLQRTCTENYGKSIEELGDYHIDHIKPMATAATEEEAVELSHYLNLQILTPSDNLKKSSFWEGEHYTYKKRDR